MNREQIDLLQRLGIAYEENLSEDKLAEIEEKVGDHLALHCLDVEYRPNEEGKLCESILDAIDRL